MKHSPEGGQEVSRHGDVRAVRADLEPVSCLPDEPGGVRTDDRRCARAATISSARRIPSRQFRGFLQVYDDMVDETEKQATTKIPSRSSRRTCKPGDRPRSDNLIPNQHFTKPPGRFTESSLVTRAGSARYRASEHVRTDCGYDPGAEVRRSNGNGGSIPTELGIAVNKILVQNFPHLFNVEFTAKMEEELDTIASGKQTYQQVMEDFYHPVHPGRGRRRQEQRRDQEVAAGNDRREVRDCAASRMIIKWGRNGRFMACSGYPDLQDHQTACSEAANRRSTSSASSASSAAATWSSRGDGSARSSAARTTRPARTRKPISIGVKCPKCKDGRRHRAEDEAEADVLRLLAVSRLRFRVVGQAGGPGVRHLRQCVHGGRSTIRPAASTCSVPSCKAEVAQEEVQQAAG